MPAEAAARTHTPGRRDAGLDVIRVLAIVVVISVLHATSYLTWSDGSSARLPEWVALVLTALSLGSVTAVSGFVIGRGYPALADSAAVRRFASRRFMRIYPLYALALTVFWFAWFRDRSVAWVVAQYACLGPFLVRVVGPPVNTLYYVSIIAFCYAAYAAIVRLRTTTSRSFAVVAVAAALVVGNTVVHTVDERVVVYSAAFLTGALLGRSTGLLERARSAVWVLVALSLAAGIGLALTGAGVPLAARLPLKVALCVASFVPLWMIAEKAALLLPARGLAIAAFASYAAYLFHRPVLSAVSRVVPSTGVALGVVAYSIGGAVLSFLVGWVIQSAYDRITRPRAGGGRT